MQIWDVNRAVSVHGVSERSDCGQASTANAVRSIAERIFVWSAKRKPTHPKPVKRTKKSK